MSGVYGNDNFAYISGYQYVSFSSTSEQSAALDKDCVAVELESSTDCYIAIGTNPTAAAPGAEKTKTKSFKLKADVKILVALPKGSDAAPMKVAVIRDSADGTLDIYERKMS